MASFAISASCHATYNQSVPEPKFPSFSSETALPPFCGSVSPHDRITESEDSYV